MLKAIIFDLDGVIIQSEEKTFKLIQQLLRNKGINLNDKTFPKRIGKKMSIFLDEILGSKISLTTQEKVIHAFYREYHQHPLKYIKPIPTVVDFIKQHKGSAKLAVASSSSQKELTLILQHLKLQHRFSSLVSSDDVKLTKPDPEIYHKSLKKLKIKPKEAIVLEDSLVGVEASNKAGIATYVVLNGLNSRQQFKTAKVAGYIKSKKDLQQIFR